MPDYSIQDKGKEEAAKKASALVKEGMLIGLGTGSTSVYFLKNLAERCRTGLKIHGVPTSDATESLARSLEIPLLDPKDVTHLDIAVDGADEVDRKLQMIKGGGGALLREKMIASIAEEMWVIVDRSKIVERLGKFPLPVEICPFLSLATIEKLKALNLNPFLRMSPNKTPFITDNGNYIVDLKVEQESDNLYELDSTLRKIPGIFETGLFLDYASVIIVGDADGTVTEMR